MDVDSNRSNSCPPVGSMKQSSAHLSGGRGGLGKRSNLRKTHSKQNQNPLNMTSYISNVPFSK